MTWPARRGACALPRRLLTRWSFMASCLLPEASVEPGVGAWARGHEAAGQPARPGVRVAAPDQDGPARHWSMPRAGSTVDIEARSLEVDLMTISSTDERQGVRTFVEHEHEELSAGIERLHELGEAWPACRSTNGQRASGACWTGSTRRSSRTWPGRSPGCSRRSTSGRGRCGPPGWLAMTIARSWRRRTGSMRTAPMAASTRRP